jgi:hypothetical protein
MEFFFVALLVAFGIGLGTGLYFGRVQSHLIYRAVMAGLVVPSLVLFVSSFGAYIIDTNYFPREDHRQNLVWTYGSLSIAVVALIESIFCFIPRIFKRTI